MGKTSKWAGSIDFASDDTGITLFPRHGIHNRLDLEHSIWWIHNNVDEAIGLPVRAMWVNATNNSDETRTDNSSAELDQGTEPRPGTGRADGDGQSPMPSKSQGDLPGGHEESGQRSDDVRELHGDDPLGSDRDGGGDNDPSQERDAEA